MKQNLLPGIVYDALITLFYCLVTDAHLLHLENVNHLNLSSTSPMVWLFSGIYRNKLTDAGLSWRCSFSLFIKIH
jgi:hypothetical protein